MTSSTCTNKKSDYCLKESEINSDILLPGSVTGYTVFDPPEGYSGYIPRNAIAIYGCLHCEWRGTEYCPYKFSSGPIRYKKIKDTGASLTDKSSYTKDSIDDLEVPINSKIEGICKYRKDYLLMLTGEWKTRPSLDTWQNRLMKNKGLIQNGRDEIRYLRVCKELEDLETRYKDLGDTDKDLLKLIDKKKREYHLVRHDMIESWQMLTGFFDKGVDRETARKIDMEVKNISVRDIMHKVSDFKEEDIKETDYEMIEEDK